MCYLLTKSTNNMNNFQLNEVQMFRVRKIIIHHIIMFKILVLMTFIIQIGDIQTAVGTKLWSLSVLNTDHHDKFLNSMIN